MALGLLAGCGASSAAAPGVSARSIGPETGGVHLVLSVRSAPPGAVVSATVTGSPLARSPRVLEVTCGVKDTRVSHPVLGLAGPGRPSAARPSLTRTGDVSAGTTLRFVVPDVPSGVCVVSRTVVSGSETLEPRATLYVG